MTFEAKTTATCAVCEKIVWLGTDYHQDDEGAVYHLSCAPTQENMSDAFSNVASLTEKLAAAERANARLLRILEGANDTIRNQREKLSLSSPKADEQFATIAKELERLGALEKRVEQIASELFSDTPSMASADEMPYLDTTCGFECSCPSLLHHRVSALRSEIESGVPMSWTRVQDRLQEILDENREIER